MSDINQLGSMSDLKTLRLESSEAETLTVLFDREGSSANIIDSLFTQELERVIDEIEALQPKGVFIRSAKNTFFAGGDLDSLYQTTSAQAAGLFEMVERLKRSLRRLETLGIPVVACIEGAALGGGWEIALACHHRIALSATSVKMGLPEVTLGLLPGGGGVARTVRLFGLQRALPLLTEGRQYPAQEALAEGLIHEVVESAEVMSERALSFIQAHPEVKQPWDVKGYRMPGGTPTSPKLAPMLAVAPAMLTQKTKGVYPAPEAILAAMVEGALVDFDTACRIESRYFVELVCSPIAKNMINAFWYQLNEVKAGVGRPEGSPQRSFKKIGILGAGMMGAGIAYASASRGVEVVLRDVTLDRALSGKGYSEGIVSKGIKRGKTSQAEGERLLSLIKPTESVVELSECELVIEAVFEDRALKARVTQETEAVVAESTLFASNTSTLPISGLASASRRPDQFIGLHFFSPVDKMKLVEIICGRETSQETLAACYDFVTQLGKIPIIVNDSRGFFTSRVFGTYTQEGIAMVGEGVSPVLIEMAAALAGFPVGPLAVSDEVSLTLMEHIRVQTAEDLAAEGREPPRHGADHVITRMLEVNRAGRSAGGGFYSYPEGGKKSLWTELSSMFPLVESQPTIEEVKSRLLYIMAVETARCLEEGVLMSHRDANLGSIFGIGFPAWTGGAIQFIHQTGLGAFVEQAEELAERHGARFSPPASLEAIMSGETT